MDHFSELRKQIRQRDKQQLRSFIEKGEWGKVFSHIYERSPLKRTLAKGEKVSAGEIIKVSSWAQRYLKRLMKNQ